MPTDKVETVQVAEPLITGAVPMGMGLLLSRNVTVPDETVLGVKLAVKVTVLP